MNKLLSILLAGLLSLATLPALAEIVNLNKADAGAFQHYLTGIGEKRAADIVKYRKEHKSFKAVDEIMQVPGIGEGIFKKIKKDLSLTKGVTSAPVKDTKKKTSTAKSDTKSKAEKSSKSLSKTASDKSSDSKTKKAAKKDTKSESKKSVKKETKSDSKKSAKKEKSDKKASNKKSSDKPKS